MFFRLSISAASSGLKRGRELFFFKLAISFSKSFCSSSSCLICSMSYCIVRASVFAFFCKRVNSNYSFYIYISSISFSTLYFEAIWSASKLKCLFLSSFVLRAWFLSDSRSRTLIYHFSIWISWSCFIFTMNSLSALISAVWSSMLLYNSFWSWVIASISLSFFSSRSNMFEGEAVSSICNVFEAKPAVLEFSKRFDLSVENWVGELCIAGLGAFIFCES